MLISRKGLVIYVIIFLITALSSSFLFLLGSEKYKNQSIELNKENPKIEINKYHSIQKKQDEKVGDLQLPEIEHLSLFRYCIHIYQNAKNSFILKVLFLIVLFMFLSRILGLYARKIGQPAVIGEIIAGILMGPSFFGWLFPEFHSFVFSIHELQILEILSSIGLILLLFVVGMDVDLRYLKKRADTALIISHSSVFLPFVLGLVLAYFIFESHSHPSIQYHEFALFIGISISITAYPLLLRILQERGIIRSGLGHIAIVSSAFVDIIGWILLSITIGLIQFETLSEFLLVIFIFILFILALYFIIQPFLQRLGEIYVSRENLTKSAMAIILIYLFSCSIFTEVIGLHAFIGAFFAGVVMPSNQKLKLLIAEKIDYIALVFLLPLFFAVIGYWTDLKIFLDPSNFTLLILVLLFSICGKFFGAFIPAKLFGLSWKDSFNLGVLMNARGLLELIVLHIGFQVGIINQTLFTILVVMTIITTFITSPAVQMITNIYNRFYPPPQPLEAFRRILISFAQPSMGIALLKLSNFLFGSNKDKTHITLIHITTAEILSQEELAEYKSKKFSDIEDLIQELEIKAEIIHRTTENVTYEILNQAKLLKSRFLFMGAGKSLFTKNILGGKIRPILSYAPCNVGVLLDNGLDKIENVLIIKKPTSGLGYEKLIYYLQREHGSKKIKVLPVGMFTALKHEDFKGFQLVIIEIDLWKEREEFLELELQSLEASFLILQFK